MLTAGWPYESPGFTINRPPVALLVDLDTGAVPTYRLEALVDLEWVPVRMNDTGRRTKSAWDKRGMLYRVTASDVYGAHSQAV